MDDIRVLVCDEHRLFSEGECALLDKREGLNCLGMANDVKSLLRLVKELEPDMTLISLSMILENGMDLVAKINKNWPGITVVVVTHYEGYNHVSSVLDAGARGYLSKSMSCDNLVNALHIIRAGGIVLSTLDVLSTRNRKRDNGAGPALREREMQILKLAAAGMSHKQIANELAISVHTVASHFGKIFEKLHVDSCIEAVTYALSKEWFTIDQVLEQKKGGSYLPSHS